jgi:hypothetical protein
MFLRHPSADIYAWGRVVVFLLTGRTAIDAVGDVPGAWRELLTACTSVVPEHRPDASAVQGSLGGWCAVRRWDGGTVGQRAGADEDARRGAVAVAGCWAQFGGNAASEIFVASPFYIDFMSKLDARETRVLADDAFGC